MPTTLDLPAPTPYDFLGSVRGHGWAWLAPCALTPSGLRRVERLDCSGRVVVVDLASAETASGEVVRATARPSLARAEARELAGKLRWMLRLDEDLAEFYALCAARADGYRAAIGRGRLLRSPTLFEDALKVILTTNTSWRQTIGMVARTVRGLGQPHPDDPELRAFPTPGAVLDAGERFLREEARLGYRVAAVLALAERADELEALRESDLPTPELRQRLLAFRGIGPYAAATLLMLLGHYDYLAVDTELRAFTARKYFGGQPASPAEVEAVYASWGRWKYLGYWLDSDATESPFSSVLGVSRSVDLPASRPTPSLIETVGRRQPAPPAGEGGLGG